MTEFSAKSQNKKEPHKYENSVQLNHLAVEIGWKQLVSVLINV